MPRQTPTRAYATWPAQGKVSTLEPRPAHLIPLYTPRTQTPERRSYRPREIARMHGLAPSTVYDAISRGDLEARRISARVLLVSAEALARWLDGDAKEVAR